MWRPLVHIRFIPLLFLLLTASTHAYADPSPPGIQFAKGEDHVRIDHNPKDHYKLGEPFHVSFTVRHPAGTIVEVPQSFESSRWNVEEVKTTTNPQLTESTVDYTFAIYRPGETTLQPFTIQLIAQNGKETPLKVGPFTTHITSSISTDETPELSSQLSGVDIWIEDYTLLYVGSALILLLFISAYLFYRKQHTEEPPLPELPPYEVAFKRLTQLRSSEAANTGEWMYFYVSLSGILREFLGKTFQIHASEMTTTELSQSLTPFFQGNLTSEKDALFSLLERADAVKFANFSPPQNRAPRDLDDAFHFIKEIKPPPPEPSTPTEEIKESPTELNNQQDNTYPTTTLSSDIPTPSHNKETDTPPHDEEFEKNLAYLPPHLREAYLRKKREEQTNTTETLNVEEEV